MAGFESVSETCGQHPRIRHQQGPHQRMRQRSVQSEVRVQCTAALKSERTRKQPRIIRVSSVAVGPAGAREISIFVA